MLKLGTFIPSAGKPPRAEMKPYSLAYLRTCRDATGVHFEYMIDGESPMVGRRYPKDTSPTNMAHERKQLRKDLVAEIKRRNESEPEVFKLRAIASNDPWK